MSTNDSPPRNKLKELSISMSIGVLLLIVFLWVSSGALWSAAFNTTVTAKVIDYQTTLNRPSSYSVSQRVPELHETLIEYIVEGQPYFIVVNSHAYSALKLINIGDEVLVAFDENAPHQGHILNFALYSTLASILWPFLILIFVVVTPQWLFAMRKSGR